MRCPSILGNFKIWLLGIGLGVTIFALLVVYLKQPAIGNAEASASTAPEIAAIAPSVTPETSEEAVPKPPVREESSTWPVAITSPEVSCLQSEIFVIRGRLAVTPVEAKTLQAGELLYSLDDTPQRAAIENLRISLLAKQAELDAILHTRIPFAKKQILYAEEAKRVSSAANVRRQNNTVRAMLVPYDVEIAEAQAALGNLQNSERQTELAIRKLQLEMNTQMKVLSGLSVRAPFLGTVVSVTHVQKVVEKDGVPIKDEYHVVHFQFLGKLRLKGTISLAEFKQIKKAEAHGEFAVAGTLLETALDFRGRIESFSPDASQGVVKLSVLFDNPRLSSPAWKERQFRIYPGELAVATISPPSEFTISKR